MSTIVTDHLDFGELLIAEANRELDTSQSEDAAYSARLATECFEAVRDVPECRERAERGIAEASRITAAAYRSSGNGAESVRNLVDRRFEALNHEAEELMRDSRAAVRAALTEEN